MSAKRLSSVRSQTPPPMLPGFEKINRYFEDASGLWVAQILPGGYYVSESAEVITTVLGSCVTTCIRDPRRGIGGMNHFMLPEDPTGMDGASARYGRFAMEQLIDALIKRGALRGALEVKVVGGGRVVHGMGDIGRSNVEFVRSFLAAENLPIQAEDVGLSVARRVRYYPATGQLRVLHLAVAQSHKIVKRENELAFRMRAAALRPTDIELF